MLLEEIGCVSVGLKQKLLAASVPTTTAATNKRARSLGGITMETFGRGEPLGRASSRVSRDTRPTTRKV